MSLYRIRGVSRAQVGALLSAPPLVGESTGTRCFSSANSAVAADNLYATPWISPFSGTVDQISVYVGTGAVGNCKVGLYAAGSDNMPAALLGECTADLSTAGSGAAITGTLAANAPVTAGGLYWPVAVYSGTPTMVCFNQAALQCGGMIWPLGLATTNSWFIASSSPTRFFRALTYVAGPTAFLPATFGAVSTAGGAPASQLIRLRRAS